MNRSVQAKGTFGSIKLNKSYKSLLRKGERSVYLELTLVLCSFNLYKYPNQINKKNKVLNNSSKQKN